MADNDSLGLPDFGFPVSDRSVAPRPQPLIVPAADPPPPEKPVGIECPKCGCRHFRVIYTRPAAAGRIQRRRECRHCGRRVTTTEKAE